jgi:hypothetical protein
MCCPIACSRARLSPRLRCRSRCRMMCSAVVVLVDSVGFLWAGRGPDRQSGGESKDGGAPCLCLLSPLLLFLLLVVPSRHTQRPHKSPKHNPSHIPIHKHNVSARWPRSPASNRARAPMPIFHLSIFFLLFREKRGAFPSPPRSPLPRPPFPACSADRPVSPAALGGKRRLEENRKRSRARKVTAARPPQR